MKKRRMIAPVFTKEEGLLKRQEKNLPEYVIKRVVFKRSGIQDRVVNVDWIEFAMIDK